MKNNLSWFVYIEELPTIFQNNETQSEEVTYISLTAKLRLKNVRLTFPILTYEFVVSSFRCIWFHRGGPAGSAKELKLHELTYFSSLRGECNLIWIWSRRA